RSRSRLAAYNANARLAGDFDGPADLRAGLRAGQSGRCAGSSAEPRYPDQPARPAPAAGATSIAFGDFSYYEIRDVMAVILFRFNDSAYVKKGQVGFMAWMRSGGNLVDVGGAVKTFKHGAAA
ncbi:TPA: phage major capsid protein, partial [Stenotrophomonas maltophilia]